MSFLHFGGNEGMWRLEAPGRDNPRIKQNVNYLKILQCVWNGDVLYLD